MKDSRIGERLERVRERVASAAMAAGRSPQDVLLIAVSKAQPAEAVREAYEAGQRDFGENYVQELVAKASALADLEELRWHMIGHLQTNKVKQVVGLVKMIQTVDRVRLVQEVAKRMVGLDCVMDVLLEVNVGGEQSKAGVAEQDVAALIEAVRAESALCLRGLMTVPPFELDASETSGYFRRLAEIARGYGLVELSMGMSHDFEEAIGQGATMVRVGTAIFGARR